jgi:hypothetical protein
MVMERTCRVCALSRKVEPEGACFCYKHKRIKESYETGWYLERLLPAAAVGAARPHVVILSNLWKRKPGD